MSFLALIMGAVLSGTTIIEYGKQPLDIGLVEQVSTQKIYHSWFSSWDNRQLMVQKAYDLWGLDFVTMIECENGNWDINARWDSSKSVWLCQMNTRWHKLPQEYYDSWEYQVEYCYQKWGTHTVFYGPSRRMKNGQRCGDYVKDRFIIK